MVLNACQYVGVAIRHRERPMRRMEYEFGLARPYHCACAQPLESPDQCSTNCTACDSSAGPCSVSLKSHPLSKVKCY